MTQGCDALYCEGPAISLAPIGRGSGRRLHQAETVDNTVESLLPRTIRLPKIGYELTAFLYPMRLILLALDSASSDPCGVGRDRLR
jgi:hypothetical protein